MDNVSHAMHDKVIPFHVHAGWCLWVSCVLCAIIPCPVQVSMKAVAVARPGGHTAGWQLRSADVTVTSFSQLSLYNVRRLFANTGYEVGDLCKEVSGKKPNKPRVRNATADPEPSR